MYWNSKIFPLNLMHHAPFQKLVSIEVACQFPSGMGRSSQLHSIFAAPPGTPWSRAGRPWPCSTSTAAINIQYLVSTVLLDEEGLEENREFAVTQRLICGWLREQGPYYSIIVFSIRPLRPILSPTAPVFATTESTASCDNATTIILK